MDGTILSQGTFKTPGSNTTNNTIANGNQMIVQIPSNADFMWVTDYSTQASAGTNTATFQGTANGSTGFKWYWQRGMPAGQALVEYKSNGSSAVNADLILTGGFTLYDPSNPNITPLLSAPVATTAVTNATRPVVSTASTAGLSVGSIVRLSNNNQTDDTGPEFVVGAVTVNTSFTLLTASNPLANVPGSTGGATGFYRIVNRDHMFYPRVRYIVNITQAVNPQVSTSVPHGMTAGQAIRFRIPSVSGMIQLNATAQNNYQYASILSVVDDYNFVIDIDTSAMSAFTWPTVVQQPSDYPQMVPVGENTGFALSYPANQQLQVPQVAGIQIPNTQVGILADATVNTSFLGMILGIGGNGNSLTTPIIGPAGSIANISNVQFPDVMYWVAGKSTLGGL
jgi:hypothetical protein